MGMAKGKAGIAFTFGNIMFMIGPPIYGYLSNKIDRRILLVVAYLVIGVASFVAGPAPWLGLPVSPVTVIVGFCIISFFNGSIYSITVPEIAAGVDSPYFSAK
jgi:MFS family permease